MAEEYGKKDSSVVTETQTTTTTTGRGNGAEAFVNDKKGGFAWWLPLLLLCLLPLLYFALRHGEPDTSAPPVAAARPVKTVAAAPAATASPAVAAVAPAPVASDAPVPVPAPEAAPEATPAPSPESVPTPDATPSPDAAPTTDTDSASAVVTTRAGGNAKVYSGKDIATGATAAASSQGEPLSDVTQFTGATDRMTLMGRKVKLTNVKVLRVITDRAYFVGGSDTQRMLVLLDKGMDAGAGPQRVNIMPGGTVSLTGVLEKVPNPEIGQEQYGLSKANFDAIGKEDVYLHATVAQKKDKLGK